MGEDERGVEPWRLVARRVRETAARSRDSDRELRAAVLRLAGGLAGRRALDLVAGEGALARVLAARGARVWALDADPAAIARARKAARESRLSEPPQLRVARPDDLRRWPRGRFDLITYVDPRGRPPRVGEDSAALLRAAAERLAGSGRLVLAVPHPRLGARGGALEAVFGALRVAGLRALDAAEPGPGPDWLVLCVESAAGPRRRARRSGAAARPASDPASGR